MSLRRRLERLERAVAPPDAPVAVALGVPGLPESLVLVSGEWLPCADVGPLLAGQGPAVKIYAGFDPRKV